jgi:hypothetical protein
MEKGSRASVRDRKVVGSVPMGGSIKINNLGKKEAGSSDSNAHGEHLRKSDVRYSSVSSVHHKKQGPNCFGPILRNWIPELESAYVQPSAGNGFSG